MYAVMMSISYHSRVTLGDMEGFECIFSTHSRLMKQLLQSAALKPVRNKYHRRSVFGVYTINLFFNNFYCSRELCFRFWNDSERYFVL